MELICLSLTSKQNNSQYCYYFTFMDPRQCRDGKMPTFQTLEDEKLCVYFELCVCIACVFNSWILL